MSSGVDVSSRRSTFPVGLEDLLRDVELFQGLPQDAQAENPQLISGALRCLGTVYTHRSMAIDGLDSGSLGVTPKVVVVFL